MDQINSQDEFWMKHALRLAHKAWDMNEVPVGAVLVQGNQLISEGWNQSITLNDPSAHAEMIAVREGGAVLNNYRLVDTTLYVTLEPCPMCAGLLVHARINRIVYGAGDYKTGAAGSVMNLLQDPKLNHQVDITGGILADECAELISSFFKYRREQKKLSKLAGKMDSDVSDTK